MNIRKILINLGIVLGLSSVVLLLAWSVSARAASRSGSSPSAAPVAVDDGGQGFITDEDNKFYTANVLMNDSDVDRDQLFVSGIDTTGTIGLVSHKHGVVDTGFDQDGYVTTNFPVHFHKPGVAIQEDGKTLLVAGVWNSGSSDDFTVLRYNPDGSLDPTFDEDGITAANFGWTDRAHAVVVQPDNKIVVAGYVSTGTTNNLGLVRFTPDGSLDLTFNGSGMVVTSSINVYYVGYGMKLQDDGKIVVVGTVYDNLLGYIILVARFNPDGSLDSSFDGDGFVLTGISNYTIGYDLAILPDHKILVSGFGTDYKNNKAGIFLARYNPDGSLDASFAEGGIGLTDVGQDNYSGAGEALAVQPDLKILVAGNNNDNCVLARFNTDGSLDTTFAGGGILHTTSLRCSDVVTQPTGEILLIGISGATVSDFDFGVIRYQADGTLDTAFGKAGKVTLNYGDDRPTAAALGQDGSLMVGGTMAGCLALARINVDGIFFYDPAKKFDELQPGEFAIDTFAYTLSDGTLTDTAQVSITINGLEEKVYLPSVMRPAGEVYGWVTEDGLPAQGVPLQVRFYNGASWFTVATTTTGPDGKYTFVGLPAIGAGQMYYVRYNNDNNPNRLWVWGTKVLTSYKNGEMVNIGNFDISNIELQLPAPGSTVGLPYIFRWIPRPAWLNDSYEFNLFEYDSGDPYFFTDPPLGYTDRYTLNGLPPGFVNGVDYAWSIWAYSPDGGYGVSYWAYFVRFVNSGPMSLAPDREIIKMKSAYFLDDLDRKVRASPER